ALAVSRSDFTHADACNAARSEGKSFSTYAISSDFTRLTDILTLLFFDARFVLSIAMVARASGSEPNCCKAFLTAGVYTTRARMTGTVWPCRRPSLCGGTSGASLTLGSTADGWR